METKSPSTGLILSCPLCEEHSLHVIGSDDDQVLQCINCGYVSSPKFIGTKEDNDEYKKLQPDMKNWSKEALERIWIPTIMTLPTGLIYPFDDEDGNMKWGYAKMVKISEEERHKYPIEGQPNKFYEQRYDMDEAGIFDEFIFAMAQLREEVAKFNKKSDINDERPDISELRLPKLKRGDNGSEDSPLSE